MLRNGWVTGVGFISGILLLSNKTTDHQATAFPTFQGATRLGKSGIVASSSSSPSTTTSSSLQLERGERLSQVQVSETTTTTNQEQQQQQQTNILRRSRTTATATTSSTATTVSTPRSVTATATTSTPRLGTKLATQRGKFQSDHYDKPIVLLGCSGSGDELRRLAFNLSPPHSSSSAAATAAVMASDLSEDDLWLLQDPGLLLKSSVIIVDFAHADSSSYPALTHLAQTLYQDKNMLSVYINVHPDSSQMSEPAKKVKSSLENSVFIPYTDFELTIKDEGLQSQSSSSSSSSSSWHEVEWALQCLLARATLPPAIPGQDKPSENTAHLTMGADTFFLSLSFPQIEQVRPYLKDMCRDVDAMEFRADLLSCRDDRFEVLHSLQTLRRMCRPHAVRAPALPRYCSTTASRRRDVIDDCLPVVYTVRTAHQAGTWPDDSQGIRRMFQLLKLGLRSCVDVLDVESAWDDDLTNELLSRTSGKPYTTQILGSEHVVGREVSTGEAVGLFRQCGLNGRAHGAKVVLTIQDKTNDNAAYVASELAHTLERAEGDPVIPHLGLVLAEVGKYSRILNRHFTPVTHESLPFVAAPGQLTAKEIMKGRIDHGIVKPLQFAILGHNIAYSVSPAMHNAAFAITKLPHTFHRVDVPSVQEFVESELWNDVSNFGGCSITIPHKQDIIPHLDELTDEARIIGAVNTVIVSKDDPAHVNQRVLLGDNTDWIGIYNPLHRRLLGDATTRSHGLALIVGAGGTARAAAYAASRLGLELVYWNRTPSKARDLALTFGGTVVTDLDIHTSKQATDNSNNNKASSLSMGEFLTQRNLSPSSVHIVISTLPHAANFLMPSWLVSTRPIVFDVNYKPYETMLLRQAMDHNCDYVRGSEMLWEQGVEQFERWTGRRAPYAIMKDVVLDNCIPK